MSNKQTLCKAKRLCWILKNRIEQEAHEEAIEYMEEQEPWLSENEDSLPPYFVENWWRIYNTLSDSEQRMEEIENTPDEHAKAQLTEEVREHYDSCPSVLRTCASVLRQAIESLN